MERIYKALMLVMVFFIVAIVGIICSPFMLIHFLIRRAEKRKG